uniref:DUF4939 domain-containing protein n=1 Tax=Pseudonaja textilis TaxID=8673 RepID=A0A670ZUX7_PSETE
MLMPEFSANHYLVISFDLIVKQLLSVCSFEFPRGDITLLFLAQTNHLSSKMNLNQLQRLVEQQEQQINQLLQSNVTLQNQVTQLLNYVSTAAGAPPASPVRKNPVAMPEKFSGQTDMFSTFLGQCQLYFSVRPEDFPTDRAKVGFIISLLTGQAAKWATPLLVQDSPLLDNFQGFLQQMNVMFENPIKSQIVDRKLKDITQGKRPLQEYVAEFRLLCMDSTWNEPAHMAAFQEGLSDIIKDELIHAERASTLDTLITQCLRIEARLQQRGCKRTVAEPSVFSRARITPMRVYQSRIPAEEPMEIGALRPRLTVQERSRRFQEGLCLYCGGSGHFVNSCTRKGTRGPVPETIAGPSGNRIGPTSGKP